MADKTKKIWVVGHKNPDTDSICAAIAYANLKNMSAPAGVVYEAKRAGEINEETKYVLKYFQQKAPGLITDAYHVREKDGYYVLKGVVSRKKQLIPMFMSALQEER